MAYIAMISAAVIFDESVEGFSVGGRDALFQKLSVGFGQGIHIDIADINRLVFAVPEGSLFFFIYGKPVFFFGDFLRHLGDFRLYRGQGSRTGGINRRYDNAYNKNGSR